LRLLPELIKAKSFTIDGEALSSGLTACHGSRSCLIGEAARTAILYAFDLIEHDGRDLRNLPFLDRKAALARLLRDIEAGVLLNEHLAEDGPTVFAHACQLGAEGIGSKKVDGTYRSGPCSVCIKVQSHRHRRAAGAERDLESMIETVVNRIASPNLTATALATGSKAISQSSGPSP
jgi:ATP-dependent DNA ligase